MFRTILKYAYYAAAVVLLIATILQINRLAAIIISIPVSILLIFLIIRCVRLIRGNLYTIHKTQDMDRVHYFLKSSKRGTELLNFLHAFVMGNYKEAEEFLKLQNKLVKTAALFDIRIQQGRLEEAKKLAALLKGDNREYTEGFIAVKEEEWDTFQQKKQNVKNQVSRYMLEASEAFHKGNFKEAEERLKLAISSSAGTRKFILLQYLEHGLFTSPKKEETANPQR